VAPEYREGCVGNRHAPGVAVRIRDYGAADQDAVVELSLRAWTPVFASMEGAVGVEPATRLHGADWRVYQARCVSETLAAPSNRGWVVEADGTDRRFRRRSARSPCSPSIPKASARGWGEC
jgi:hypothetical protein